MIIDADTHVDESEDTWAKLLGTPFEKYIPVTVSVAPEEAKRAGFSATTARSWVVEGRLQNRALRDEINHPPRVRRELEDVAGRIKHMDEMGVDVQVIFPTFFIRYNTRNLEAEQALTWAYNRWIAEKCKNSQGRLRWAAVLPLLDTQKAADEARWAKANGACAIFRRGFDLDRKVTDSYFFPIYEEVQAQDLALCIHTGHPLPGTEWDRGFPIIHSLTEMITTKLPEKFPRLRFGLIEAGASWIPYSVSMMAAQLRAQQRGRGYRFTRMFDLSQDLFRKNRIFVTLDAIDEIEHLLKFGTEDNLMIGTDYSHTDISANLSALKEVRDWVDQGRITEGVARKILELNPRNFYGF